jgi:hypothetical protein
MTGEHMDDSTLEAALRAAEVGGGEEQTLGRVQARVQAHVRGSNAGGTGWSRGQRFTVFAAIAVPAAAAAGIAAVVVFGHGFQANKIVQPAATPNPTATAVASATPNPATQTVVVEMSTPPKAAGPETVHWVTTTGTELATKQLPTNEAVIGAGSSHVLVYRSDGHILDLHIDGSSQDVGDGMPTFAPSQLNPGPTSVPVAAIVSPDGSEWLWGQIVSESANSSASIDVTSTITLGGIGMPPHVVARAVENSHALEPYSWTLTNPLISHAAIGVGGYLLFHGPYGEVDQIDLATGQQTPVPPNHAGALALEGVALAETGAVAYAQTQDTIGTVVVNGPGQRGLSANVPAHNQTGGLLFDPSSNHLVFATSPGAGPPHEHFETDILDLNSGARTKFGPPDLRPSMWLPDDRLVEFRTTSDGDGAPGTYLVSLDGGATKISSYDRIVGIVEIPGP